MTGTVRIEGNNLVFELDRKDSIIALKKKLTVPLNHVSSVSSDTAPWVNYKEVRIGGAGIPGTVKVGRYTSKEGKILYDMHDPDKCITVMLKDEKYVKVVFEVENKDEICSRIQNSIEFKS